MPVDHYGSDAPQGHNGELEGTSIGTATRVGVSSVACCCQPAAFPLPPTGGAAIAGMHRVSRAAQP
jgi:hypothetical protein